MPSLATFYSNLKSKSLEYTLSTRTIFNVTFNLPNLGGNEQLFDFVVRSVTIPNISSNDGHDVISNPRGKYIFPKQTGYTPSDNTFKVTFLETEFPFIENYIEPWFKTNTMIMNRLVRRKIIVKIFNSNPTAGKITLVAYDINDAWPEFLDMPELDHTRTELKLRSVVFAFNEIIPILNTNAQDEYSKLIESGSPSIKPQSQPKNNVRIKTPYDSKTNRQKDAEANRYLTNAFKQ